MRTPWIIFYLLATFVGLFLFHGVPVLNVALGFPLGALVAWHLARAGQGGAASDGRCAPAPQPATRMLQEPAPAPHPVTPMPQGPTGVAHPGPEEPHKPLPAPETLKNALRWAMGTALLTVLACWCELAGMLLVTQTSGAFGAAARWVPLLPPPETASATRMLLFAVLTAPALQVLTTAFGALLAVLIADGGEPNTSSEGGPRGVRASD